MKICVIGKYPPVQGGVSTRTYRYAHGLAARGHEVHVVTNAGEVAPPFRAHMRDEDWARCEGRYGEGSVTVHWTDPADRHQFHIPMGTPFVTKLSSLAAAVAGDIGADAIFSYYAEPYAVAGHLAAEIRGIPHIVRTAGSDAGRLWDQPQFAPLYDHVFRSADVVLAGGRVARKMIDAGVDPARIFLDRDYFVELDLFRPDGPALDLDTLAREVADTRDLAPMMWGGAPRDIPFLGVYGKLGSKKGTLPLLRALARLKEAGTEIGLLLMAHPRPRAPHDYRQEIEDLGLTDRVLQIPFLPNWRVPEFIRRCLAVCCLEQDFPIRFHTPIIAREVLACGGCLVGSTEVLAKLPDAKRLADGYNCVAVKNVEDVDTLAAVLGDIVADPAPAAEMGARGRAYVRDVQSSLAFPEEFERILSMVAEAGDADPPPPADPMEAESLSQLALDTLPVALRDAVASGDTTDPSAGPVAAAIKLDAILARAREDRSPDNGDDPDPLFRLTQDRWALPGDRFDSLVPGLLTRLRIERFDYDVAALIAAEQEGAFPTDLPHKVSFVAERVDATHLRDGPFVLDDVEARMLDLCDGVRTVGEVCSAVLDDAKGGGQTQESLSGVILHLFETALLRLDARGVPPR